MKKQLYSTLFLLFVLAFSSLIHAQITPTLSIQGILKKSNGVAVEDGNYSIIFKLYNVSSGGAALWTETQSGVEVSNGIYSATLPGDAINHPLNLPFNELYYLGVTVGSTELTPRILLTSAPYALSLIGTTNKFPSSGKVVADSIQVNGSVLARGGTPGLNGANKNGYAFSGNSGDKDSGLFSTADGKVSLYANNTEILAVTPTNVQSNTNLTVQGAVTAIGANITNNGSVSYNGQSDWRLVDTDNFNNDSDGWKFYDKIAPQNMGWNNPNSGGDVPTSDFGSFIGDVLYPASNDHVVKKQFNPNNSWGSFTEIKVKFRYYFIDTWGWGGGDRSWAAFATNAAGSDVRVGWTLMPAFLNDGNDDFNADGSNSFGNKANFAGTFVGKSDNWMDAEMTARAPGASFWVFIGAAVDMDISDERFAVSHIEVYVK